MRYWFILGVLAIAMLGAGAWFALQRAAPQDASALLALSLPDPSGQAQSLGQWRGKVVVVNFWATWCVPCREEMPEFVLAQNELGPKGLQFVGIAVDDAAKARAFAKQLDLNYPVLVGGYDAVEISKTYGNRLLALPFTIVIDRQGRIAHTQLGPFKPEYLHSIVGKLL